MDATDGKHLSSTSVEHDYSTAIRSMDQGVVFLDRLTDNSKEAQEIIRVLLGRSSIDKSCTFDELFYLRILHESKHAQYLFNHFRHNVCQAADHGEPAKMATQKRNEKYEMLLGSFMRLINELTAEERHSFFPYSLDKSLNKPPSRVLVLAFFQYNAHGNRTPNAPEFDLNLKRTVLVEAMKNAKNRVRNPEGKRQIEFVISDDVGKAIVTVREWNVPKQPSIISPGFNDATQSNDVDGHNDGTNLQSRFEEVVVCDKAEGCQTGMSNNDSTISENNKQVLGGQEDDLNETESRQPSHLPEDDHASKQKDNDFPKESQADASINSTHLPEDDQASKQKDNDFPKESQADASINSTANNPFDGSVDGNLPQAITAPIVVTSVLPDDEPNLDDHDPDVDPDDNDDDDEETRAEHDSDYSTQDDVNDDLATASSNQDDAPMNGDESDNSTDDGDKKPAALPKIPSTTLAKPSDYFPIHHEFHKRISKHVQENTFLCRAAFGEGPLELEPGVKGTIVGAIVELKRKAKGSPVLAHAMAFYTVFCPQRLQHLRELLNTEWWIHGKGGKQAAFCKISNCEQAIAPYTPMVIGGQYYTGTAADESSKIVLRVINFVMGVLNECLVASDLDDFSKDQIQCNILHGLVGQIRHAVYKTHTDANSHLLIREPFEERIIRDDGLPLLPTKTTMVVPTIILQSRDFPDATTILNFTACGKGKAQVPIGEMLCYSNFMHLQFQGTNDMIYHNVKFIKNSIGQHIDTWRMVLTGRHSLMNIPDNKLRFDQAVKDDMPKGYKKRIDAALQEDEYKYSNVLTHIESGCTLSSLVRKDDDPDTKGRKKKEVMPADDNSEADGLPPPTLLPAIDLNSPENVDTYPQLPKEVWLTYGFERPPLSFAVTGPNYKTLCRGLYTSKLLENRVLVDRCITLKTKGELVEHRVHNLFQLHDKFLLPLQEVTWKHIAEITGIDWVDKNHPLCQVNSFFLNTVNLSKLYKSKADLLSLGVRELVAGFVIANKRGDERAIFCAAMTLISYIGGGSRTKAGTYSVKLSKATKEDAHTSIQPGQDSRSNMNNALLDAIDRNGVVAVFIDYDTIFRPILQSMIDEGIDVGPLQVNSVYKKNEMAVFLGYYQLSGYTRHEPMGRKQMNEYYHTQPFPPETDADKANYSFMMQGYTSFILDPTCFGKKHYQILDEYNQQIMERTLAPSAFTTCTVVEHDKKPIPYVGVKNIDYECDGPDLEQQCAYFMEKKIWTQFSRRDPEGNLLTLSSEENPVDTTFMIEDPNELVTIGLFICAAEAIRSDKDNVLKPLPEMLGETKRKTPQSRRPVKLPMNQDNRKQPPASVHDPFQAPVGKDCQLYANPLPKTPSYDRLGTVLQVTPIPHVIRDLNLPALLLRAQVSKDYELDYGSRLPWCKLDNPKAKADLFFQAILLRFTGRVKRFSDTWFRHENKSMGSIIPSIAEWPTFTVFLERTTRSDLGSMTKWISRQHDGMIPTTTKVTSKFISIFTHISRCAGSLTIEVNQIIAGSTILDCHSLRDRILKLLNEFLLFAITGTSDRERVESLIQSQCEFLAYQWIADLEAVLKATDDPFSNPFGEISVTSIVPGIGGDEGFRLLKTTNEQLGDWRKKIESTMPLCHNTITNTVEDGYLAIMGCQRIIVNGRVWVVVKLNGRPISYIDVEHWLCKGKIFLTNLHASRTVSRQPVASKHYCLPIPVEKAYWDVDEMRQMYADAWKAFCAHDQLVLPDVCKFLSEQQEEKKKAGLAVSIPTSVDLAVVDQSTVAHLPTHKGPREGIRTSRKGLPTHKGPPTEGIRTSRKGAAVSIPTSVDLAVVDQSTVAHLPTHKGPTEGIRTSRKGLPTHKGPPTEGIRTSRKGAEVSIPPSVDLAVVDPSTVAHLPTHKGPTEGIRTSRKGAAVSIPMSVDLAVVDSKKMLRKRERLVESTLGGLSDSSTHGAISNRDSKRIKKTLRQPVMDIRTQKCFIPLQTALVHFTNSGNGLYRKNVSYREVTAQLLQRGNRQPTTRQLLCFRTVEYYRYLSDPTVWFESDFIYTYGALVQQDSNRAGTWFFNNPDYSNGADEVMTLPTHVDRVITIVRDNNHYAVLDIKLADKTIDVYDGLFREDTHLLALSRWRIKIRDCLMLIGSLPIKSTCIPKEWNVQAKLEYEQQDTCICGGLACIVIEQLFRYGKVHVTLRGKTSTYIRAHVLSYLPTLRKRHERDIFIQVDTAAAQEKVREERKNESTFDITAIAIQDATLLTPITKEPIAL